VESALVLSSRVMVNGGMSNSVKKTTIELLLVRVEVTP